MTLAALDGKTVRFGVFEADLKVGEVRRQGIKLTLQEKPFQVLAALLAAPGRVVTREELRRRLWAADVHVEFDKSLNVAVRKLRRALKDSVRSPRFIETLPRRGYRFLSPVVVASDEPPEARAANLKARYALLRRTPEGLRRAKEYFQRAVELDGGSGGAYAGLATAWNRLGEYSLVPPREAYPRSRVAAQEALKRDPNLAEAHAALAFVQHNFDWAWRSAERTYRRALALNPDDATTYLNYAEFLSQLTRHEQALAEIRKARQLDPASLIVQTVEAWILYHARRYQEAVACCEEALRLDPTFAVAHYVLGRTYLQQGRSRQALRACGAAVSLSPGNPYMVAGLGFAHAFCGQLKAAHQHLAKLMRLSQGSYTSPYAMAKIYAGLGERNRAFQLLGRAYRERSGWLVELIVDPELDGLRPDPRFAALLRRLKFPR